MPATYSLVYEMVANFTVAVRSDASQMPLVMAASGPCLMTPPPLRPGQHLVGRLRGDRLPQSPEHMPNFRHGQWEEFDAHIDGLLVGPPFATWLLLVVWLRGRDDAGVCCAVCCTWRWARSTAR